jgi:hypothetical protein
MIKKLGPYLDFIPLPPKKSQTLLTATVKKQISTSLLLPKSLNRSQWERGHA